MKKTYEIIRGYFHSHLYDKEVIATGLTLKEAQSHCGDPETSWKTCKKAVNVARTEERGPWFDGYEEE